MIAQFSQKIILEQDIYLKILSPLVKLERIKPISHNNNSIVARLKFNEISFLFYF